MGKRKRESVSKMTDIQEPQTLTLGEVTTAADSK